MRCAALLGRLLVALALLPQATAAQRQCLLVSSQGEVLRVEPNATPEHAVDPPADHFWCWSATRPPERRDQLGPEETEVTLKSEAIAVQVDLGPDRSCAGLTLVAAPTAMWREVPESLLPSRPIPKNCTATVPRSIGEAWRLRVFGQGLGTWWRELDPEQGAVGFQPIPSKPLRFQVTDSNGLPLPNSKLDLLTYSRTRQPSNLARFIGADGHIEIPSLPEASPATAVFGARSHVPRTYESVLHTLPRLVALRPSTTVGGQFVDPERRPIAGVEIQAEAWLDSAGKLLVRRKADSSHDGRWTVEGLPAGEVVLWARSEGFAAWRVEMKIEGTDADLGSIALQPGVNLSVLVTDPEGTPVPDAIVSAGTQASARSDGTGLLELKGLIPAPGVRLKADAPGFLPTEVLVEFGDQEPHALILRPAFEVTGRFLDSNGVGIEDGRAEIVDGSASNREQLDSDGGFWLELEPGKAIELRLTSPRIRRLSLAIDPGLPGEVRDLGELRAPPSLTATGRVIAAEDESPVAGARIWVPRPSADDPLTAWFHGDLLETATDGEGNFSLGGLDRKPFSLTVEAAGFAMGRFRMSPGEDGQQVELGDLVVSRGSDVLALIEEEVSLDAVARLDLEGSWREMDMLTAPVDGDRALFRHVPPGQAILTVMDGRKLVCEASIDLPTEPGPVEVACRRPSMVVSGVVQVAGYPTGPGRLSWLPPAPDHTSTIMRRDSPLGLRQTYAVGAGRPQVDLEVGVDGYFHTEDLRAGDWRVVWFPESGGSSKPKPVALPLQERLEIQLDFPGRAIEGQVTDSEGSPIRGARVRELESGGTTWSREGGAFRLLGLSDGEYYLRADHAGTESQTAQVWLVPDEPVENVRLVLGSENEREELSVVVESADERPIAGAFVFVDAGPNGLRILTTDSTGRARARLDPPYPAQLRLAAWAEGSWYLGAPRPYSESLEAPSTLRLAEGGSIELISQERARAVNIRSDSGWDITALRLRLGSANVASPDAPLIIQGLPTGSYSLRIDDRSWRERVRASRLTSIDLDRDFDSQ